ncbi:MAG: hypothetical protein ACYTF9_13590, partial [Planctomycetota bacterium]
MTITDAEQRVIDELAARGDRMQAELAEHVAIPTGKAHVAGLDAYRDILARRLESLRARVEIIPGTPAPEWTRLPGVPAPDAPPPVLVARGPGGPGPRILLAGHIDTVHDPAGDFDSMTLAADGLHATGPGVVDMK